jgi:hypothetical protein
MSTRAGAKKTFTYDEAAAMVPEVRRRTEDAVREVDALQAGETTGPEAQARAEEAVRRWMESMRELGIEVKGLWLIDFDNGSGYYCWQYPEPSLQYYHGYEDGFGGRMRIQ